MKSFQAMKSDLVDLLLERSNGDPTLAKRVMLICIDAMPVELEDFALDAIAIARQHWFEGGNELELENARQACWEWIDENHSRNYIDSPEVAAARSIIFVLNPKLAPEEIVDKLYFFVETLMLTFQEPSSLQSFAKIETQFVDR